MSFSRGKTCWPALVMFLGQTLSCAGTQTPAEGVALSEQRAEHGAPIATLEAAEQAYNLGDPVRALQLLDQIGPRADATPGAADLKERVSVDVDAIARGWMERIQALEAKRQYRAADARAQYLQQHFPMSAELCLEVSRRRSELAKGIEEARVEVEELEREATDHLLRHDFTGGLKSLRRAESLAAKYDYEQALEIERRIAAAEHRFAQEKLIVVDDAPEKRRAARKPRTTARRRRTTTQAPAQQQPEPEPPEAEENPHAKEVQQLLRLANRLTRRKSFHRAIVALEQVRKLDPQNEGATAALGELEPRRKALVREYLAKANEHFLRQDLAAAVPYFQKVLELDPKNEDAREGLEMYENLERIRRQRTGI